MMMMKYNEYKSVSAKRFGKVSDVRRSSATVNFASEEVTNA